MPTPTQGQLTVAWDGTSLRVEAPGRNGARQKVEGISFSDLPLEMRQNLSSQLEAARDRARAELMDLQRKHVEYSYENYGVGADSFVQRVWGSGWAASRTLKSRLAKAGQYDPISGKIKAPEKPTKEILDLDL